MTLRPKVRVFVDNVSFTCISILQACQFYIWLTLEHGHGILCSRWFSLTKLRYLCPLVIQKLHLVYLCYMKKKQHGALEMNNMSFIKVNDEKGNNSIRSALIRKNKVVLIYSVKFEKNVMQTAYPLKWNRKNECDNYVKHQAECDVPKSNCKLDLPALNFLKVYKTVMLLPKHNKGSSKFTIMQHFPYNFKTTCILKNTRLVRREIDTGTELNI